MERKTADEYPQELLDLFHEYQHGDIDRRSFLRGAARLQAARLPQPHHPTLRRRTRQTVVGTVAGVL